MSGAPARLDARSLRRWPLPPLDAQGDKEERGSALVVAGSREVPGAAALAGLASLRAGAGRLVVASAAAAAPGLALALPEARAVALPETRRGGFALGGLDLLDSAARQAAAALIGPGCMDEQGMAAFVQALLPHLAHATVVLDAGAMGLLRQGPCGHARVVVTPHAGEMAHLRGMAREDVEAHAVETARAAARDWGVVVALKGASTVVACPSGEAWLHQGGHPGLGTSGSGDVLAGLVAGLAARGAEPAQAAAWGVVLHGLAGHRLARRVGPVGFLAREIAAEAPALLRLLGGARISRRR